MSYYYLKNEEKNGLEIYFGEKPSEDILNRLKEAHWRWYSTKGCWYTKYSKEKENFAKDICSSPQSTALQNSSSESVPSNESSVPQPISMPDTLSKKYKVSSMCRDSALIERNRTLEKEFGIKDISLYYYVTEYDTVNIIGEIHAYTTISKSLQFVCTVYDEDNDIVESVENDAFGGRGLLTSTIKPKIFFDGFPFTFEFSVSNTAVKRIVLTPVESEE